MSILRHLTHPNSAKPQTDIGLLSYLCPDTERTLKFDAYDEIPLEDFKKLKELTKQHKINKRLDQYANNVALLNLVFPGRSEMPKIEEKELKDEITALLDAFIKELTDQDNPNLERYYDILALAYSIKFSMPDEFQNMAEQLWEILSEAYKQIKDTFTTFPLTQVINLSELKQLFPDKEHELAVDPNLEEQTRNLLNTYKNSAKWEDFIRLAAHHRIVFPDKAALIKAQEESAMNAMKATLKEIKEKDLEEGLLIALLIKILDAEKVLATDDNLLFTMPPRPTPPIELKLPIVKQTHDEIENIIETAEKETESPNQHA